jgi:G:T-mismatch repair DNA endonuclease (very short patch repair protein)
VFCDGDFWHGRRWNERRQKLAHGANGIYWTAKIASNIERDRRINRSLRRQGWTVLRVWETDVLRDPVRVVARVLRAIREEPDNKAARNS